MNSQDTIIQYLIVSSVFLWIIVIVLFIIKVREYLEKRLRIRAVVMDEEGKVKKEYFLSNQKEMIIGKSTVSTLVHIDFSGSPYVSSIEEIHANLKKIDSYWYLESEASNGMVGLKKQENGIVYKLKKGVPYQIGIGDVIYISYEKIYLKSGS